MYSRRTALSRGVNERQRDKLRSQHNVKTLKKNIKGVLSGEKQRVSRGYDFVNVCHWFAERADLILLLFDAHKLDISDEFKAVIERLKGQDDKIRVILNKADQVRLF